MSVTALTTAIAVAATPLPGGEAPAPNAAFSFALTALDQAPIKVEPAAGSIEVPPPIVPANSTEPSPSNQAAQAAEPETGAPALPAQPESRALPSAMGQTDIVVTGRRPSPDDPLEELNATSFEVTQSVDKAIVAPIAFVYVDVMPRPIRMGLRNFLRNLGEPVVFLNYLLQLKPGKAAETVGRFVINTAVGAAGIVDVAKRKPFNLPHRRNGFANTLGYYGVPQGPYFYLPVIGPTTLRDFIGNRLDVLVFPLAFGKQFSRPEVIVPIATLNELNSRIEYDDEVQQIRAAGDPYVASRSYYLRKRQAEIEALHGRGNGKVPVILPPSEPKQPAPVPAAPDSEQGSSSGAEPVSPATPSAARTP